MKSSFTDARIHTLAPDTRLRARIRGTSPSMVSWQGVEAGTQTAFQKSPGPRDLLDENRCFAAVFSRAAFRLANTPG